MGVFEVGVGGGENTQETEASSILFMCVKCQPLSEEDGLE